VHIELDNGRRVNLPESYAHDGHLDHAYATTAHRAQGTTVDRAFVLGSDELYREWSYTALSRHRGEARFYITAPHDFLNQAPQPLRDSDIPLHVAQMLADSRAEHLLGAWVTMRETAVFALVSRSRSHGALSRMAAGGLWGPRLLRRVITDPGS